MNDIKTLLNIRKDIKSRKPDFIRQDSHKKAGLGAKWRKPKGLHAKMRLKLKGYRKIDSKGYRSPKLARNLHKSGLAVKIVNTVRDVEKIKKGHEGGIIAKNVGQKKKVEILKKAKELDVKILNVKDINAYLGNVEKEMAERKKVIKKEKEPKKEKNIAKKEEKLVEKLEDEEKKKEEEKKKKDRILTKRV